MLAGSVVIEASEIDMASTCNEERRGPTWSGPPIEGPYESSLPRETVKNRQQGSTDLIATAVRN